MFKWLITLVVMVTCTCASHNLGDPNRTERDRVVKVLDPRPMVVYEIQLNMYFESTRPGKYPAVMGTW